MKCNQCGSEFEGKFCPNCGAPAQAEATTIDQAQPPVVEQDPIIPSMPIKTKKPVYKKWWFWVVVVIVVIGVIANLGNDNNENGTSEGNNSSYSETATSSSQATDIPSENESTDKNISVVDFSSMDKSAIESWASSNGVKCKFSEENSDTITKGAVISQSINAGESVKKGDTIKVVISKGKKVSIEYKNALSKAETYSKMMHMSKQGIYDQLTSEYGEKFPADAAQYAVDNMSADWNKNALEKAKTYQQTMNMSKSAIYDQLISQYGEKFTKEQAQYAIDHLE